MANKVKSTKDKITENKNAAKNKTKMQKPPKAKASKVEQLHPKVKNKDSLTDNIKKLSAQSVKDSGLGKIQRVALNRHLSVAPKRKKK